jgi:RimJ/RimL family protein N-acetyltransferase
VSFVVDIDGTAVGSASLFEFDSFARHAEAGISLVPDARGRGIGTAAIAQLVEFGFVRRNLRRIHLQAIASNTGAIRAYEKAGSWWRAGCANMRGSEARTRTSC